jgi:hypothetical protein
MTKQKTNNHNQMTETKRRISSKVFLSFIILASILFSIGAVRAYASPAAVNLGTAGNFVILAKTGISSDTTSIVGNIGVSPAAETYITGFSQTDATGYATSPQVTGFIYAADMIPPTPTKMTTAILDMQTAYTDAAGRTLPDSTELGAGDISGMTLAPGLYKLGTGVTIKAGDPNGQGDLTGITLSGNASDVFIFQIAQDLTVGNGAIVTLSGGVLPQNIFWQVAGQATLGTTAQFKGIILSQTAIILNTGATLNGRALAQSAVTLQSNTAVTSPDGTVPILTTITLSPNTPTLTVGSTLQLSVTNFDQSNFPIAATINYATSDSSVATVDTTSGLVTAIAPGTATITATSGTIIATSLITVIPPVTPTQSSSSRGGGSSGTGIWIGSSSITPTTTTATATKTPTPPTTTTTTTHPTTTTTPPTTTNSGGITGAVTGSAAGHNKHSKVGIILLIGVILAGIAVLLVSLVKISSGKKKV